MATRERTAVISDVHSNLLALDAVLEDISRREISRVVNLGDSVYGPLDPAGTAARLMDSGIVSIRGNQDRVLFDRSGEALRSPVLRFVRGRLSEGQLAWLRDLHSASVLDGALFCHGTPSSDETYLLERVALRGVVLDTDEGIRSRLDGAKEKVIFCGHSHVPRTVWVSENQIVVNPGSVGLPAYADDDPYPHAMESGSPHARYAILSCSPRGYAVEHVQVPYPWSEAAAAAKRNGHEDWASWISTGRAKVEDLAPG